MFVIQESRYGDEWVDHDLGYYPFDTLEEALKAVRKCDDLDGKYTFRIVDDDGVVYYQSAVAYEPLWLDIVKIDWLEAIRQNYGVSDDIWKRACEYWLDHHV
jgi:hypothetical protein